MTRAPAGSLASGQLNFWRDERVSVPLPNVHANVIEIGSPTRKPLQLSYRHGDAEVTVQKVAFLQDNRRLLAAPAALDLSKIDHVFITGMPKVHYELKWVALMESGDEDCEAVATRQRLVPRWGPVSLWKGYLPPVRP
jgi:hypothetical protein